QRRCSTSTTFTGTAKPSAQHPQGTTRPLHGSGSFHVPDTPKAEIAVHPAGGDDRCIPNGPFVQLSIIECFSANPVPRLGGNRGILKLPLEILQRGGGRRTRFIHELPHVTDHLQRTVRARAVNEISHRQELVSAHVGSHGIRLIAPRIRPPVRAASSFFP